MRKKNALMLHGGWDGHEPEACVRRFVPVLESKNFTVTLSNSLAILDEPAFLQEQDLIVPCWTMGALSESQESNLVATIEAGTGLAGWHGGLCDAFRSNTAYQFMTGGQFVAHPGDVREYTVHIAASADPIVEGMSDFRVCTEQYYMHVDPANEVLATTVFTGELHPWIEGIEMPVVWKRQYGAARVFYSALGHVASDFDVYETFTIMARGMHWAARS